MARGYQDHIAGHITVNRGDGTLWCNPRLLRWDEVRPEHAIVINLDGDVLEGDWPAPAGIPLHLALHRARPDLGVVVHGHPLYSTVWAGIGEAPPPMDQTSATGSGDPVLVAEYAGTVNDYSAADATAARMGDAESGCSSTQAPQRRTQPDLTPSPQARLSADGIPQPNRRRHDTLVRPAPARSKSDTPSSSRLTGPAPNQS